MKEITIEEFTSQPQSVVDAFQHEQLLITRDGEPLAVVVGVENRDAEDWAYQSSDEFWSMIEARRQRPTISLADLEAELFGETNP